MKTTLTVMAALIVLVMVSTASAVVLPGDTYEYEPPNSPSWADLESLEHGKYYQWGMAKQWSDDEVVVSATLTLTGLKNYNNAANDLWIHLLDNTAGMTGTTRANDSTGGHVDEFAGQGEVIRWFHNELNTTRKTFSLPVTPATLEDYASNNDFFSIGVDGDCHFYACSWKLEVVTEREETTEEVPEPATMGLLGLGAIGMLIRKRKTSR